MKSSFPGSSSYTSNSIESLSDCSITNSNAYGIEENKRMFFPNPASISFLPTSFHCGSVVLLIVLVLCSSAPGALIFTNGSLLPLPRSVISHLTRSRALKTRTRTTPQIFSRQNSHSNIHFNLLEDSTNVNVPFVYQSQEERLVDQVRPSSTRQYH